MSSRSSVLLAAVAILLCFAGGASALRSQAYCQFTNTSQNAGAVTGFMSFVRNTGGDITVTYEINGLSDGDHAFHIHNFGDLVDVFQSTSTGGHFVGICNNCRPAGSPQEVGLLNNGAPFTSTTGSAKGTFSDNVIQLSGDNSIIGRSVVIHGKSGVPAARVAHCVIGLNEADEPGSETSQTRYMTTRAACLLRPTSLNPDPTGTGIIYFDQDKDTGFVRAWYTINGLTEGPHAIHVHQIGNIAAADGSSTGGHYKGQCDKCRPDASAQEVGLLQNGAPVYSDQFGSSSGLFYDKIVTLNGPNSIIGRSVVVHAADMSKALQCVIGKANEIVRLPSRPPVKRAVCSLLPTRLTGAAIGRMSGFGNLTFVANDDDNTLTVTYYLVGLNSGPHAMYVGDWGTTMTSDGLGTGGRFIGQCLATNCKPDGARQEIGSLNNGQLIMADDSNLVQGTFVEQYAKLNGKNSILGRSLVILGNLTSDAAVVSQCVIGVGELNEPGNGAGVYLEDPPTVTEAFCHMEPNAFIPQSIALGTFWFQALGDSGVSVTYYFDNLEPGFHAFHVHAVGDISAPDMSLTGPHFIGNCSNCRTAGNPQEVGLLNDGVAVWASATGVATGTFIDMVPSLNGPNSIIGRSVVIHAPKESGGAKLSQCVIGINKELRDPSVIALAAERAGYAAAKLDDLTSNPTTAPKAKDSKGLVIGLAVATGVLAVAAIAAFAFAKSVAGRAGGATKL